MLRFALVYLEDGFACFQSYFVKTRPAVVEEKMCQSEADGSALKHVEGDKYLLSVKIISAVTEKMKMSEQEAVWLSLLTS